MRKSRVGEVVIFMLEYLDGYDYVRTLKTGVVKEEYKSMGYEGGDGWRCIVEYDGQDYEMWSSACLSRSETDTEFTAAERKLGLDF